MALLVVALLVRILAPPKPVGQESPASGSPVVRVSHFWAPAVVVAVVALVLLAPRLQESTGARAGTGRAVHSITWQRRGPVVAAAALTKAQAGPLGLVAQQREPLVLLAQNRQAQQRTRVQALAGRGAGQVQTALAVQE